MPPVTLFRPLPSVCVLMVACGGAPRAPTPARNSVELQAEARNEEARFAHAVADEASKATRRLDVEAVTPAVAVDRRRGLVYSLQPQLVALDIATGTERWRLRGDAVLGASLSRAGSMLVVVGAGVKTRPRLVFVSLEAPHAARTCELALPAPPEADEILPLPFDRRGELFVYWRGSTSLRQGGPPHSGEELRRRAAAESCGIVSIDPSSCQIAPTALRPFLLDPPRERGAAVPIAADDCRYLTPELDMPSVAASRAPPSKPGMFPSIRVVTTAAPEGRGNCSTRVKKVIEAEDSSGARLWQSPLPDEIDGTRCPGPP